MKKIYFILMFCLACFFVHAQNNVKGNKEVFNGNKSYDKGDLKKAQSDYEQALKLSPNNLSALVNLGLSQSKQNNIDAAVKNFDEALGKSKNAQMNATLNYDKGTTLANAKKYEDAIKAFENSLRINPNDNTTRENLQKAINELKKQQQQNQQNNQNKQNQQQNKDQQQQQDKQNKKNQQQQEQNQMSKQQYEQMLKALRDQEKETQKKLNQQKAGNDVPQNGKDW